MQSYKANVSQYIIREHDLLSSSRYTSFIVDTTHAARLRSEAEEMAFLSRAIGGT